MAFAAGADEYTVNPDFDTEIAPADTFVVADDVVFPAVTFTDTGVDGSGVANVSTTCDPPAVDADPAVSTNEPAWSVPTWEPTDAPAPAAVCTVSDGLYPPATIPCVVEIAPPNTTPSGNAFAPWEFCPGAKVVGSGLSGTAHTPSGVVTMPTTTDEVFPVVQFAQMSPVALDATEVTLYPRKVSCPAAGICIPVVAAADADPMPT